MNIIFSLKLIKNTDLETNFSGSGGLSTYRLVVINSNNAYTIYTTDTDIEAVNKLLGTVFSQKLNFKNN